MEVTLDEGFPLLSDVGRVDNLQACASVHHESVRVCCWAAATLSWVPSDGWGLHYACSYFGLTVLLQINQQSLRSFQCERCLATRYSSGLVNLCPADGAGAVTEVLPSEGRVSSLVYSRRGTGSSQPLGLDAVRCQTGQCKRGAGACTAASIVVRVVQQDVQRCASGIEGGVSSVVRRPSVERGEVACPSKQSHGCSRAIVRSAHAVPTPEAVLAISNGSVVGVRPRHVAVCRSQRVVHRPQCCPERR